VLQKHQEIFNQRYGKFTSFKKYNNSLKDIFEGNYETLFEIVIKSLNLMLEVYDVKTKIVYASELDAKGSKSELMLNLTKAVGGDIYLSGRGAEDYMDDVIFHNNNMEVEYQNFYHLKFDQKLKKDFQAGCLALELPFMYENFIDLLYDHYKSINQLDLIRGI